MLIQKERKNYITDQEVKGEKLYFIPRMAPLGVDPGSRKFNTVAKHHKISILTVKCFWLPYLGLDFGIDHLYPLKHPQRTTVFSQA